MRVKLICFTLAVGLLVAACGSSNRDNFSQISGQQGGGAASGQIVLKFDESSLPQGVDSIQAVFLDATGGRLGDVVEVPLTGTNFVLPGTPPDAATLEIDYLRNGGFALYESFHAVSPTSVMGQRDRLSSYSSPVLYEAAAGESVWSTSLNPAAIKLETSGNPGKDSPRAEAKPFPVRGVGYSPAPIGTSNKNGPNFGDLFWDGFYIEGERRNLLDWEKVWKRDIDNIRARFNAIRVYSLIAEHVNDAGQFTNPPTTRTHQKFLDACWNNGHNPVYVMVGVPLPSDCFLSNGNASNRANWERVYASTLEQTKNHPAVMGYTFFNEIGGSAEWGGDTASSNFYWGQVKKYADQGKAAAPNKLVGFSYFDAPNNVNSARSYMNEYGSSIDFWGVNSFQATVIAPTLAPYKALGEATKPVLFTEFGVPATSHRVDDTCEGGKPSQDGVNSIYADADTIQKAADAMSRMLPMVLSDNIVGGMFYFEWNDEYWKQDPNLPCYNTSEIVQEGGVKADRSQMPNGFNDEEGFGLHAIATQPGRDPRSVFAPFDSNARTANNFPDVLTPRQALLEAVTSAFAPIR